MIDLPSAVNAEVPTLVNEAMRSLQSGHNFKVMETETGILTTTLATRPLSSNVPTDYKEFRGKPYLIFDSGRYRRLLAPSNRSSAMQLFSVDDPNRDGEPRALLDSEPNTAGVRAWAVYPFPDGLSDYTNGEYRIVVPYWRFIPAMSSDADTNWFTVNAEEFLVFQATSMAFALDWDEERMAVWAQLAADRKREIILEDKRYRMSGVNTFVPHHDVFEPTLRN